MQDLQLTMSSHSLQLGIHLTHYFKFKWYPDSQSPQLLSEMQMLHPFLNNYNKKLLS